MIKFSKFTHNENVGKILELDQVTGQYSKMTIGNLKAATVEIVTLNNISELPTYLSTINGFNHSTAGISPIGATMAIKGPPDYEKGIINRSNKDLPWPENDACLFVVDNDDAGGKFTWVPALKDFACVQYTSSGSMVYGADGTEYVGFKGCHTIYAAKSGKAVKKAFERLHQREIIAWRGQCKVSEAGTFLERSCYDRMLASPSQPIYHKATCLLGLVQKQIIEYVPGNLEPIDLEKVVPPLTKEEKQQYIDNLASYEEMLAPEMSKVRQQWINARVSTGITREHAEKALDDRALEHDFVIHTKQGDVTVKEILADPVKWNNVPCKDPVEPDYGSNTVAKIYSFQQRPMINSNAHGGVTYSLYDATSVGFGADAPAIIDNETGKPVEHTNDNLPGGAIYNMSNAISGPQWTANQVTPKMDPISTLDNFRLMLHYYGITVAYDVIAKDILLVGQNMRLSRSDLKDNANIGFIKSMCELNKFKFSVVPDYLNILMDQNQINPVKDWITSKPWDEQNRLKELFETLTLAPEQNRDVAWMMFRKWFLGAVRIGTGKINAFEFVLCLQEPKGGSGKTRWFKRLCPDSWQSSGVMLDPTEKDSVKIVISRWINELGELDSIFGRGMKALMAFLGKSEDEIRLPYGTKSSKFARRSAFFGSVNKKNFLVDDSGDRRIWPISVIGINYQHEIDMQQVWAQMYAVPESETHWLDTDENNRIIESNKDFKTPCLIADKLESYFNSEGLVKCNGFDPNNNPILAPVDMVHLNATDILIKAGIERPTQLQLNKVGPWVHDKGFEKVKRNGKSGYLVPSISEFI